MPSISVSLPTSTYGRVIDYQDRHDTSLSHAAASLIRMGFAWDAQAIQHEKDRKQKREAETLEAGAKAALEATIQEEAAKVIPKAKKSKGKAQT